MKHVITNTVDPGLAYADGLSVSGVKISMQHAIKAIL